MKADRDVVELSEDVSHSPLWNPDLAPTPLARRTWSTYHIAALWIGMSVVITTYTLASGLLQQGMTWWQAMLTILLGNVIVLVPMILNAHAGTKYGVSFPVLCRASFGVRGANVPAILRALVACGWFGIQTWIGGLALDTLLAGGVAGLGRRARRTCGSRSRSSGWCRWRSSSAASRASSSSKAGRRRCSWPAARCCSGGRSSAAAGSGTSSARARACRRAQVPFWQLFPAALTANVGYWATLSLNIPDFTRYARSQRSQALGQALGLPATMTAFAFIGVAVTSATVVIFGEAIWDPVVLIARIGNPPVIIFGALVILLAQLTTNMAANVVSPANDFSSLAPRRISYVAGGLITAAIGILMMPWKLYADAAAYIFTWLLGYSSLMGAIGGVLIADYWLLRRRQLSLPDLFKPDGRYAYTQRREPPRDLGAGAGRAARGARLPPRRHDAGRHGRRSGRARHALHLRLVRHLHPERRALSRLQPQSLRSSRGRSSDLLCADRSGEQVACAHETPRQKRRRDARVRREWLDQLIGTFRGQRVAHDAILVQIHQPVLRHAALRVHVGFDVAVEVDRRIRDLDDEQDVSRPGMRRRVEVGTWPQQHDVRLGLGIKAQSDRALNANNRLVAGQLVRTRVARSTLAACRGPIGVIASTSPSMSSTRSPGDRMPVSPMRWYSSAVKRRLRTAMGIGSAPF